MCLQYQYLHINIRVYICITLVNIAWVLSESKCIMRTTMKDYSGGTGDWGRWQCRAEMLWALQKQERYQQISADIFRHLQTTLGSVRQMWIHRHHRLHVLMSNRYFQCFVVQDTFNGLWNLDEDTVPPGSGKTVAYLLPMICHICHQVSCRHSTVFAEDIGKFGKTQWMSCTRM